MNYLWETVQEAVMSKQLSAGMMCWIIHRSFTFIYSQVRGIWHYLSLHTEWYVFSKKSLWKLCVSETLKICDVVCCMWVWFIWLCCDGNLPEIVICWNIILPALANRENNLEHGTNYCKRGPSFITSEK